MHQRFSLIANHLQQEMPVRTDGQRPRFKITQPNLKCEDLKRKTPKRGEVSGLLPRILCRYELGGARSH